MSDVALRAGLPPGLDVSLVERYTDGVELSDGFVQGLRFEILAGKPSFRVGVRRDERADITVEITAAAARELNTLHTGDAKYSCAREDFLSKGDMRVNGDPSRVGSWLEAVHDSIVDRTN